MVARLCLISFGVMTLLAAPAPGAPAPAAPAGNLPTVEELKANLAAGKGQEVMRDVARLLALKGPAAASYDRYELYMLRGEAALRTKAMPMAADSFASAAKETQDETKQSVARANEILMRRSKPTGYVARPAAGAARPAPGSKPPGPMPIIEEADRKAAMEALLSDELTAIAPKLTAAQKATSLAPIAEVAKTLGDLRALELAAAGSAERTKSISSDIGQRAHELISAALQTMEARVEEVWRSASRQTYSTDGFGNRVNNQGLWGMTSVESNDVKGVMATCEKIVPTARDFAAVTGDASLQADAQQAEQLYARAKEVVEYDYANAMRRKMTPEINNQNPPRRTLPGTDTGVGIGR